MSQNIRQVLNCTFVFGDEPLTNYLELVGIFSFGTTHLRVQGHETYTLRKYLVLVWVRLGATKWNKAARMKTHNSKLGWRCAWYLLLQYLPEQCTELCKIPRDSTW